MFEENSKKSDFPENLFIAYFIDAIVLRLRCAPRIFYQLTIRKSLSRIWTTIVWKDYDKISLTHSF